MITNASPAAAHFTMATHVVAAADSSLVVVHFPSPADRCDDESPACVSTPLSASRLSHHNHLLPARSSRSGSMREERSFTRLLVNSNGEHGPLKAGRGGRFSSPPLLNHAVLHYHPSPNIVLSPLGRSSSHSTPCYRAAARTTSSGGAAAATTHEAATASTSRTTLRRPTSGSGHHQHLRRGNNNNLSIGSVASTRPESPMVPLLSGGVPFSLPQPPPLPMSPSRERRGEAQKGVPFHFPGVSFPQSNSNSRSGGQTHCAAHALKGRELFSNSPPRVMNTTRFDMQLQQQRLGEGATSLSGDANHKVQNTEHTAAVAESSGGADVCAAMPPSVVAPSLTHPLIAISSGAALEGGRLLSSMGGESFEEEAAMEDGDGGRGFNGGWGRGFLAARVNEGMRLPRNPLQVSPLPEQRRQAVVGNFTSGGDDTYIRVGIPFRQRMADPISNHSLAALLPANVAGWRRGQDAPTQHKRLCNLISLSRQGSLPRSPHSKPLDNPNDIDDSMSVNALDKDGVGGGGLLLSVLAVPSQDTEGSNLFRPIGEAWERRQKCATGAEVCARATVDDNGAAFDADRGTTMVWMPKADVSSLDSFLDRDGVSAPNAGVVGRQPAVPEAPLTAPPPPPSRRDDGCSDEVGGALANDAGAFMAITLSVNKNEVSQIEGEALAAAAARVRVGSLLPWNQPSAVWRNNNTSNIFDATNGGVAFFMAAASVPCSPHPPHRGDLSASRHSEGGGLGSCSLRPFHAPRRRRLGGGEFGGSSSSLSTVASAPAVASPLSLRAAPTALPAHQCLSTPPQVPKAPAIFADVSPSPAACAALTAEASPERPTLRQSLKEEGEGRGGTVHHQTLAATRGAGRHAPNEAFFNFIGVGLHGLAGFAGNALPSPEVVHAEEETEGDRSLSLRPLVGEGIDAFTQQRHVTLLPSNTAVHGPHHVSGGGGINANAESRDTEASLSGFGDAGVAVATLGGGYHFDVGSRQQRNNWSLSEEKLALVGDVVGSRDDKAPREGASERKRGEPHSHGGRTIGFDLMSVGAPKVTPF